jgi:hypothetical protein
MWRVQGSYLAARAAILQAVARKAGPDERGMGARGDKALEQNRGGQGSVH